MAKRKRRRQQPKRKRGLQAGMARHANVPRFLVMLTVGLVAFFVLFFWLARQTGTIGSGPAATNTPTSEAPAPPP